MTRSDGQALTEDQLWDKLFASERLPYGRARTAEVEQVIRHADAQDLQMLRYTARIFSIEAYGHGGEPGKAFVPFAWCVAAYDRGENDPRADYHLFWSFKAIVARMTAFPEISLEQTMAVLDDMERRYRRAGHTMNPVHQHRELVARHVGDRAGATEQYRLWCASPRGEMSDCIGCEPSSKVEHLSWIGRYEEAVAVAQPVLGGEFTCVEQPQVILTDLLVPYLHTGRPTEAAQAHRRAYRAFQHDRAALGLAAQHVTFCGLTGNHARGLELVERHLGWLDEAPTPATDKDFSAAAAFVLGLVAQAGHADAVVRRPAFQDREATEPTVAALHEELAARALTLAHRFDARNGTTEQSDQVRATLGVEPLVDFLPLSGPARAATGQPTPSPVRARYPDSPQELADLAEHDLWLNDDDSTAAAWRRFDEVCPDPAPALRARRLTGQGALAAITDAAAAEEPWRRAAELFAEAGDEIGVLEIRSRLGALHCKLADADADAGLAELEGSIAGLAELGGGAPLLRARIRLAVALRHLDRLPEATELLIELSRQADELGEAVQSATIRLLLADLAAAQPDADALAEAQQYAERAERQLEAVAPASNLRRRAQFGIAKMRLAQDDPETAYQLLGEAAQAADPMLSASALGLRGVIAMELDRPAEAYEHFSRAVALEVAAAGEAAAAHTKIHLAAAAIVTGLAEMAADAVEEALPHVDEPEELARARFLLARAYRALGQPEQALTLLDQVLEYCAAEGNPSGVAQMHELAGEIFDQLDRDAEAAQRFAAAASASGTAERRLEEIANRRSAALSWHWANELDRATAELATADALVKAAPDEPAFVWQRARLAYDAARIVADDQPAEALHRVTAAAADFRSLDCTLEAVLSDVLRARLLHQDRRDAEAEPLLAAALTQLPPDNPQREQIEDLLAEIRQNAP